MTSSDFFPVTVTVVFIVPTLFKSRDKSETSAVAPPYKSALVILHVSCQRLLWTYIIVLRCNHDINDIVYLDFFASQHKKHE